MVVVAVRVESAREQLQIRLGLVAPHPVLEHEVVGGREAAVDAKLPIGPGQHPRRLVDEYDPCDRRCPEMSQVLEDRERPQAMTDQNGLPRRHAGHDGRQVGGQVGDSGRRGANLMRSVADVVADARITG